MQISVTFTNQPEGEHTLRLQSILGKGKFQVYHAKFATLPNSHLALKFFPKDSSSNLRYAKEEQFLSKLNHPHIISYFPVLQHNAPHNMIATEYTPNGDFFEFVTQNKNQIVNNEKLIRTYFRQLIEGVEYMHNKEIVHLDLKLENILLDKDFNLKILDFDQAQYAHDSKLRSGGTEGYRAPELIGLNYKDLKALDIYAAGILLYIFFTGEMPFVETKKERIPKSATFEMFRDQNDVFWGEKEKKIRKSFSKELKELLSGMWEEDVEKRMRVEDVKRSRWYNGEIYDKERVKDGMSKVFHTRV